MTQKSLPTKEEVIESPKDTITTGKVVGVEVSTWREFINDEEKIKKFGDDADKDIVIIRFECLEHGFNGTQTYSYQNPPSDRSNLGRFLNKYESFDEGTEVKIDYDENGFMSIRL